jgi:hypothetical protein
MPAKSLRSRPLRAQPTRGRRCAAGQLHRIHDQFDRRVAVGVVRELRVVVADHLVGPVEDLLAVLERDADQTGNGL